MRWESLFEDLGLLLLGSGLTLLQQIPAGFSNRPTITVPELEYLVGMICAVFGLLLLGWLMLGTLAAPLSLALARLGLPRGAAFTRRLTPGFIYRLLAVALGGSLLLAPAAQAAPTPPQTVADAAPGAHVGTGADPEVIPGAGWAPQQVSLPLKRLLGGSSRAVDQEQVVVRRGDSLWTLAQRELGPDAQVADIARAWPRWYEVNRQVVGDDPDLLEIGTVLLIPTRQSPPVKPPQAPTSRRSS